LDRNPLLGSADKATIFIQQLTAGEADNDFGHIEPFIANDAADLVLQPMLEWIRNHEKSSDARRLLRGVVGQANAAHDPLEFGCAAHEVEHRVAQLEHEACVFVEGALQPEQRVAAIKELRVGDGV